MKKELYNMNGYPYINKGLEGIVAFSTKNSFIDGQVGKLIYSGYTIEILAQHSTFEECCFLLWYGRLPKSSELKELREELIRQRALPPSVLNYLQSTSKEAEPMAVVRTAISMLADYDSNPNIQNVKGWISQAINVTAKVPTIITTFDRYRRGLNVCEPLSYGSTAYNFLYMLNGKYPGKQAEKTIDCCLILHLEHGMNASTFTCRTICSTKADMYGAMSGAMGALKGPLHGGANTAVMNMLLELEKYPVPDPKAFIQEKLDNAEKISGFGHRVYKTMDPRAKILRPLSKQLAEETDRLYYYEWSEKMVAEMKKQKNLDPNVDFFSATVYYSTGIEPDLYTCIFAMSRIPGWAAHYIEQAENNRLIRPRALYVGKKDLEWVPIENR